MSHQRLPRKQHWELDLHPPIKPGKGVESQRIRGQPGPQSWVPGHPEPSSETRSQNKNKNERQLQRLSRPGAERPGPLWKNVSLQLPPAALLPPRKEGFATLPAQFRMKLNAATKDKHGELTAVNRVEHTVFPSYSWGWGRRVTEPKKWRPAYSMQPSPWACVCINSGEESTRENFSQQTHNKLQCHAKTFTFL